MNHSEWIKSQHVYQDEGNLFDCLKNPDILSSLDNALSSLSPENFECPSSLKDKLAINLSQL